LYLDDNKIRIVAKMVSLFVKKQVTIELMCMCQLYSCGIFTLCSDVYRAISTAHTPLNAVKIDILQLATIRPNINYRKKISSHNQCCQ